MDACLNNEGLPLTMSGPALNDDYDFLQVDHFIKDMVSTNALSTALEKGLIDKLCCADTDFDGVSKLLGLEVKGLRVFLDLLKGNRVLEESDGVISLSRKFRSALQYRDLLETKIDFSNLVVSDFQEAFWELLKGPGEFMARSKIFDLFRYDRCFDSNDENREKTSQWMRITTCLTRYEAEAAMQNYDFSRHREIMDIGGNSGEFMLRICQSNPHVQATVFDLPVVCDIGQSHIAANFMSERIRFTKGDIRCDKLPGSYDLIVFKSFLHDWPDEEVCRVMEKARDALSPNGVLLIFERGPIKINGILPYFMIPNLLFMHFLRQPDLYLQRFSELGLSSITIQKIKLEMPFYLLTAKKVA